MSNRYLPAGHAATSGRDVPQLQRRRLFRQVALGTIALSAFAGPATLFPARTEAATDPSLLTDVN
ncbi:hypothetical protein, partial [Rhizosaccharibacter radicis]|nr:hypothetical protein [Acetobacteraceae bacterium KSS12]